MNHINLLEEMIPNLTSHETEKENKNKNDSRKTPSESIKIESLSYTEGIEQPY